MNEKTERNEQMYNMHYNQGKTHKEIADHFGVTPARVSQVCRSYEAPEERNCAHCETPFIPNARGRKQLYCDVPCRQAAAYERAKEGLV